MKLNKSIKTFTVALLCLAALCACSESAPSFMKATVAETTAEYEPDTVTDAAKTPADTETLPATDEETAEQTKNVTETGEPAQPAEMRMVIATLNIKHGADGLDRLADAIREISPDIIGLQEVDVNCTRSGSVDEPAELSRLTGLPYHAFSKAISQGDGEYGTAILSRYPIESFETVPLDSGKYERRSAGHAVINADGVRLDVLVTHLTYEDREVRTGQMKTIASMLSGFERCVLTADLNCFDLNDLHYLGGEYYVNRPDRRYDTFRRFDGFAPDNIVVSEGFTEISSGVSDAECSDHRLLYAVFTLVSP